MNDPFENENIHRINGHWVTDTGYKAIQTIQKMSHLAGEGLLLTNKDDWLTKIMDEGCNFLDTLRDSK